MPDPLTLGQLVATPGALDRASDNGIDLASLLDRHQSGDWGEVDAEDKAANDRAFRDGDMRILSSYGQGGECLWIITEADRSVTTVLRPEDY